MNVQPDISTANAGRYRAGKASARTRDSSDSSHLVMAVARAFEIALSDLRSPTRGRREVALARQSAIYLARTVFGMTLADAGGLFNRDRTTAAHACRLVEDLRDHPHFDQLLMDLEDDLRAASNGSLQ
jgi:chromosomal replication initiation ATPase DnaA